MVETVGNSHMADSREQPTAFVDSSAIVALVDADDAAHSAAVEAYRQLCKDDYRLFTTDHVLVETYDLLANGVGPIVASAWLRDHRLPVYYVDEADMHAAAEILAARPVDSPISFVDALSLSVMERLGVGDAFAVDPHFLSALS
jgi:predicted nucleic acid-binding protein